MRYFKLILLTVALLFSIPDSFASHIRGSEMYYEHVVDSTYDFYLKVYRDCSRLAFTLTGGEVQLICWSNGKQVDLKMTRQSLKEITTKCPSASSECNPLDLSNSGDGIEEYVFKARVDFGDSIYVPLTSCGKLYMRFKAGNRIYSITTASKTNIHCNYLETNLKFYKGNSSPKFSVTPVTRINSNQPVHLDFGATDKDDDSLSFHMAPALNAFFTPITYYSNYSAQRPVSIWDLNGNGIVNPHYTPPLGFYFDNSNGQMIFTAYTASETPIIVVEVKEWRKDSTGKYKQIGRYFREIIPTVGKFSNNNYPSIKGGSAEYDICEGDSLRIQFVSNDVLGTGQTIPDTTVFSWTKSISNATLITTQDTSPNKKAVFAWHTQLGDASPKPYEFVVTVSDQNCPLTGYSSKIIKINVAKQPKTTIVKTTSTCKKYKLKAVDSTMFWDKPSYLWKLYDTSGNQILDRKLVKFSVFKDWVYGDSVDVEIVEPGTYVVSLETKNGSCNYTIYDTIIYTGSFDLITTRDTIVCLNSTLNQTLIPSAKKKVQSTKWFWQGDTTNSDSINAIIGPGKKELKVQVIANDGCMRNDILEVQTKYPPKLRPLNDTTHCSIEDLRVEALDLSDSGYVTNQFLWSWGGTSNSAQIDSSGMYWLKASNSCGLDSVSFHVIMDTVFTHSLGKDKFVCDTSMIILGGLRRKQTTYIWNTGDTTSQIEVQQNGTYNVEVRSACVTFQDTIVVSFDRSPVPLDWEDNILYCDSVVDVYDAKNNGTTYLWDDGTTLQTKKIDREGWHKVVVSSKHCGSISDSTYAVFIRSPKVSIGNDTGMQKPLSLILDAGVYTNPKYKWSTGATSRTINIIDYGTYWVEVTNVCGSDMDSITVYDNVDVPRLTPIRPTIYPIPSNGLFMIKEVKNIHTVELYNALGERVSCNIDRFEDKIQISVDGYQAGVYTVVVQSGEYQSRLKLLLE